LGEAIDGFADYVKETSLDVVADRHLDGRAGIGHFHTPDESFGTFHGNGSNAVFTEVLLSFQHYPGAIGLYYFQGIQDVGQLCAGLIKGNIYNRTNDLGDSSYVRHLAKIYLIY
jgi:hypothetical protein